MNNQLENYYLRHPEAFQGCLLTLKYIILNLEARIILEMIQIDPNADLPVEMIAAKLREQMRMYEDARQ